MSSVVARDGDVTRADAGVFERIAADREHEVDQLLDMQWWKVWSWLRRPWDSEARKSLARIKTSLQTARDLHERGRLGSQESRFVRALERPLVHRSLDSLIEMVYALDELLVASGDAEFLRRREAAERLPDSDGTGLAAVEGILGGGRRIGGEVEPEAARQTLLTLYEMRRFRYRRQRARRRMKTAVLLLAGVVLLGLVTALAFALDDAIAGEPNLVILAGVAGALGGTLANLFRLRDDLSRGTELRAFKPMLVAQPAVGAASGLVLLLIVEGGFLGIGDQPTDARWATVTLLSFAAGLSEALFLGIVRKAARAVSDDTPATDKPGRPGAG
jgi:hypothetical protein